MSEHDADRAHTLPMTELGCLFVPFKRGGQVYRTMFAGLQHIAKGVLRVRKRAACCALEMLKCFIVIFRYTKPVQEQDTDSEISFRELPLGIEEQIV
jgi:hypothetical protein